MDIETQSPPDSGNSSHGDIDVDALIAQAEGGGSPPAEQAPPTAQELYEFKAMGKQIKGTREQMLQWAAQGYGAPTRIGELTKKLAETEARQKQYDEKYGPIDEYVRQNPQFWDHVTQTWQSARTQQQQAAPTTDLDPSNPLVQRIQKTEAFIQSLEQKQAEERRQQEDAQLNQQIQSFRDQFKDLDWNSTDENGHNLELQVLNFAAKNGIKDFEVAFKASQYDNLLKRAEERGKEQVAKTRVQNGKLGLLGKTSAPKEAGITKYQPGSGKSDNDVFNEALRELGIN